MDDHCEKNTLAEQHGTPSGSENASLIKPSGGFRSLRSYRVATIIYDATVSFTERFVERRSRTRDQMVQAARSGRQNIAEGSKAAAVSCQTELRLTNVARASLEELLLDYQDFLRQNDLDSWSSTDPRTVAVREVASELADDTADDSSHYARWLDCGEPEDVANALVTLIHQANYLLDRQLAALERAFVADGDYRGRGVRAGGNQRDTASGATAGTPVCPKCKATMVLRTAGRGPRAGRQFWGCSGYPECWGTREV